MSKLIVFIVLLVHSIGHLQGAVVALGLKDFGRWNADSWLLGKFLSAGTQHAAGLVLFIITSLLALACALCIKEICFASISWKFLAVLTATFSSVSMLLFPNAFAMFFNYIGAIAVDVIIFYTVFISDKWLANLS